MKHRFSPRSYTALVGVRPELCAIATLALSRSDVDFMVTEGLRTLQRQMDLVQEGKSKRIDSKHLTGHAIDIAALIDGKVSWSWSLYETLAIHFKQAAIDLDIPIAWGGDWRGFRDGVHFELLTPSTPGQGGLRP